MLSKYSGWVYRSGIYKLFLNTELLAEMYYDEDDKEWNYTISIQKSYDEYWTLVNTIKDKSVDVAKETVEDIIEQIIESNARYYQRILDIWKGDLDVEQW